jgi:hypothetical protein
MVGLAGVVTHCCFFVVVVLSLFCRCFVVVLLLLCCCFFIAFLLPSCCFFVAFLLLSCCFLVVCRLPPEQANVFGFVEHQTWVVNVEMQRGGGKHIISGSVSGDIKFWDIRGHRTSSIKTIELHRSAMTALAVHEFAPIVASGSHNQFIKIMDTGGNLISMIRYHEGFLGQRIGPVSCLEFHPHRPVLAAGATDSIVAIYSSRGKA